ALEVEMQQLLLERMALHVAQKHLLHVAVQRQIENGRIEPLVLRREPDIVVVDLDAYRGEFAAVDDGRNLARIAQAAARTPPVTFAAFDLDFMCSCHCCFALCCVEPPRGGDENSPATRRVFKCAVSSQPWAE